MRRCPIPEAHFKEERLPLTSELTRYLCIVLRLRVGDQFIGFDGQGWERRYELEGADEASEGRWARALEPARQGRIGAPLTLCYAVPKGEKIDLVARQITELGVGGLSLWAASRSVAIWKREKVKHKRARLEKVLSEAARPSGRADVPSLSPPAPLKELISAHAGFELRLYLDPRASSDLSSLELQAGGQVALLVGPEGGVSPEELALLDRAGWRGVALSCPVLRTETAAVVGAALVLEKMGWL